MELQHYISCGDADSVNDDEPSTELDLGTETSNMTLSANNQQKEQAINVHQKIATIRLMDNLTQVLENQGWINDVKLLIFAAAAHSDSYRMSLVPVPSVFMGDAFYDIDGLRRLVSTWSSCRLMLKRLNGNDRYLYLAETGSEFINLLHWVLVWQAHPAMCRIRGQQFRQLCSEMQLRRPMPKPTAAFRIDETSGSLGSKSNGRHAYFGCPLHLLYRLLIMRDVPSPMWLCDQFEAALAQCPVTSSTGWPHSRFGHSPRCVIICKLPEGQTDPTQTQFCVPDPTCVQLRYLLFFAETKSSTFASLSLGNHGSHSYIMTKSVGHSLFRLVRWVKKRAMTLLQGQPKGHN